MSPVFASEAADSRACSMNAQTHQTDEESAVGGLQRVRMSEERDDYPYVVAVLDERRRVIACKDDIQWIVQRRKPSPNSWRGHGYFRSKSALLRRCGAVSPEAAEILAALPDRYVEGQEDGIS